MASGSPFGEHLKRERELRGVSIEEVSSATKISTKFLAAIENGHWEQLPGGAFNRGFIRSASRYLGLNEESMVAEYSLETNGNGDSHASLRNAGDLPRDWRPMAALGAIVVVVAAALIAGGWFAISKIRARRAQPAVTAKDLGAAANASGGSTTTTPPASASALTLDVKATRDASLRVVADGKPVFEGPIKADETKQFGAAAVLEVLSSDAGSVQLELNGHSVTRMGPAGQPGRVTLTAKDLKSSAGGVH
jgi:cytoskeleton protein RodZ